jgi:NTE family protein
MAESGIDVRDADVLIGTSSGARVALQLASWAPLEEVFARQIGASERVRWRPSGDPAAQRTIQLPMDHWPERRIQLIALNAKTGVRRAFDQASGIDLADAVMATTASFGAAPVWFEGQPYIDGGYYSSDNADLAAECGRVLVLALKAPPWAMRLVSLEDGIAELRASGAEVELIQPDDEAMEVIASAGSPMNPAVFEPVTRAGPAQGLRVVAQRGMPGFW